MRLALILARPRGELEQYLPLGLGYLASFIRARLPEIEIAFPGSMAELVEFKPHLVGISCATAGYPLAVRMAKRIKAAVDTSVCVGGVHISTAPMSLDRVFDFGVVGEGERTLHEVCLSWFMRGAFEREGLANIRGLVFWDGDELVQTPVRAPIEPLDVVPFPDRAGLGYGGEPAHMVTSRGCPYNCRFCSSRAHWKTFRAFSAEYVVAEIEHLASTFGTREVHFYDDLFAFDRERLVRIADGLSGKSIDLKFSCAVRAELVDDELCEILRRLGVDRVTFGAESASDRILKNLKGPSASVEANEMAVRTLVKHGFKVGLSFILGEPEEKKEDALKTYVFIAEHIKRGDIDMADVNILVPFPGSHYWRVAEKMGLVDESAGFDWKRMARPWRGLLLNEGLWTAALDLLACESYVRRLLALYEYPRIAVGTGSVQRTPNWLTRYVSLADCDEKDMARLKSELTGAVRSDDAFVAFCAEFDDWMELLGLLWYAHLNASELVRSDRFVLGRGELAAMLIEELHSLKELNVIDRWLDSAGLEADHLNKSDIESALSADVVPRDDLEAFRRIVEYFEMQSALRHKTANLARSLWKLLEGKKSIAGRRLSERIMWRILGKLFA